MDLAKVLAHLHGELDDLNEAIAVLERLQRGRQRRGQPSRLVPAQPKSAIQSTGKQPAKTERRHP